MPDRLTAKSLAVWRASTLVAQGGVCALCKMPMTDSDKAVGDHDHTTGQMRGVLHRSCNALLGNIENNRVRYGLRSDSQLSGMLKGVVPYLLLRRDDETPLYPTHRTPDEKRVARNTKARKARAAIRKAA